MLKVMKQLTISQILFCILGAFAVCGGGRKAGAAEPKPDPTSDWRKVDWKSKNYDTSKFVYPKERYSISGTVVDEKGVPLGGAAVTASVGASSSTEGVYSGAWTKNRSNIYGLINAEMLKEAKTVGRKKRGKLSAGTVTLADGGFKLEGLFGSSLMGDWVYTIKVHHKITWGPHGSKLKCPRIQMKILDIKIEDRSIDNLVIRVKRIPALAELSGLINSAAVDDSISPTKFRIHPSEFAVGAITDKKTWETFAANAGLPKDGGVDWDRQVVLYVILEENTNRLRFAEWNKPQNGQGELVFFWDGIEPFYKDSYPALVHVVDKANLQSVQFSIKGRFMPDGLPRKPRKLLGSICLE